MTNTISKTKISKAKPSKVLQFEFGKAIEAFPHRWSYATTAVAATIVGELSRVWSRDEWVVWLDGVERALSSVRRPDGAS